MNITLTITQLIIVLAFGMFMGAGVLAWLTIIMDDERGTPLQKWRGRKK